jgi:hypothetical protein
MIGIQRWRILDEKECFDLIVGNRTVRAAHKEYIRRHPDAINPKTGVPPTYQSVCNAYWRYILRHPEETRPILTQLWGTVGVVMTDDEWKTLLASHSKQLGNKRKAFLAKYGLEPYLEKHIASTMRDPTDE